MPYLKIEISGNTDFQGYLSIDKDREVKFLDGDFFRLSPGGHYFELHSTSPASRGLGGIMDWADKHSSGAYIDPITNMKLRNDTEDALGSSWNFQMHLGDNDIAVLSIIAKGDEILGTPTHSVYDMDEEMRAAIEEMFKEMDEEAERIANTPRRSKKMIAWGAVIVFFGVAFSSNGLSGYLSDGWEGGLPFAATWGSIAIIGILLIIFGMRKKIRK